MAYPGHWLFVMGGVLDGGADAEVWQCGIRGQLIAGDAPAEVNFLNGINDNLATWYNAAASRMRTDSKLTFIKLNAIAPNGDYLHPNDPHTRVMNTPGGQSPNIPSFLSIATSWKTDSPNKRALNGRIYLPNTPSAPVGTSRISANDRNAVMVAGVGLLGILRNEASGGSQGNFIAAVVSKTGETHAVTRVRVGDVLDVQRRRKNALRESYVDAPIQT